MWRLTTDKVLAAIAPSNKAGVMFQCGLLTDSYCCSPSGAPCSCENGNVTLAAAVSDVYSIAYIPSSIPASVSETVVVPHPTTDSSMSFKEQINRKSLTECQHLAIEIVLSRTTSTIDILATSTSEPTSSIPSENRSSSSPSSSSHDTSREGAAIGIPVAILSVIILVLIVLLVGRHRRTQPIIAKLPSQIANNRNSSIVSIQQQRLEMPGDIAAMEMEARERPELVA